ncbi:hypothetical protein DVDV_0095 [Desulfovibrio sp. DV]|uniref:ASCH domain-containing protein n=1 Tax=Desulfovibrio sp. DV TaxID=1844708 RepID=UPI00094BAFE0|nr:ASCH domain-containing protein [Desulfovibrio sp. DV]OLN31307.1 hypothetical protein DVDV_0095 [Desulfovibrio sp. DV]
MRIPTLALSVQQPWAWLIVNGFKPLENRTWVLPAKHVGPVLIQASAKPLFSISAVRDMLYEHHARYGLAGGLRFPEEGRQTGGIVGMARFTGCTRDHVSPWAARGQWHWLIADAKLLPFMPCKGRLGFFRVDYAPARAGQGSLMGMAS